MMSVHELFYGNQTTSSPGWILSTAAPGPLSYYNGLNPNYGAHSTYFNNYPPPRYDDNENQSTRGNSNGQNFSDDSYGKSYGESKRQDNSRQQHHGSGGGHGQQAQQNRRNATSSWTQDSSSRSHDQQQQQQRGRDQGFNSNVDQQHYSRGNDWDVRRPSKTVELKVPLCCEGCEERICASLLNVDGVESVKCDQYKRRVVVRGSAPAATVLKVCKKLFKRSEIIDASRKDNSSSNYNENMR